MDGVDFQGFGLTTPVGSAEQIQSANLQERFGTVFASGQSSTEVMNAMKGLASALMVAVFVACVPNAALSDSIYVSENWYIRVTGFSLFGSDFLEGQTYGSTSTPLIVPELRDPDPNHPGVYRSLLFDFHAGYVTASDEAYFVPFATVGSIWSGTMSFNWTVQCANPRILLSVDAAGLPGGGDYVWWSAPSGSGFRSGSASFYTCTLERVPPQFHITIAPVPEPSTLCALLFAISLTGVGFVCKGRGTITADQSS